VRGDGGRPVGSRRFLGAALSAAAAYLGVPADTIRLDLAAGKALSQVASSQGKTVDGLVAAMVAAERRELARGVAAGVLSQAQADAFATRLRAQTAAFVEGRPPGVPPGETTT